MESVSDRDSINRSIAFEKEQDPERGNLALYCKANRSAASAVSAVNDLYIRFPFSMPMNTCER